MTTQPNTEPLKVGDECREAFEQWAKTDQDCQPNLFVQKDGVYENPFVQSAWEGYQAAWNRRTEPSPAEVGSEGLPKLPEPEAGLGLSTAILHAGPVFTAEQMYAYARQALSQQSPARVEGELTDALRDMQTMWDFHDSRKTVNDATMRAWSKSLSIIERAVCFAHPVSDDQQAKDAALSDIDTKALASELIKRIDAALSTTKQPGHPTHLERYGIQVDTDLDAN